MINKRNLALAVCVFICGWILGSNNRPVPLITSSVGGASYEEGYQTTAGDKLAAVKKRVSTGTIHIVNPGDSIQSVSVRNREYRGIFLRCTIPCDGS